MQTPLDKRFRSYLPVVVDIETGGFDAKTNPLLEIAAVIVELDGDGQLAPTATHSSNITPFDGCQIDKEALKFTGIDPYHPFRMPLTEVCALEKIFAPIKVALKRNNCTKAILVGHNPAFDMAFLHAAIRRCKIKNNPFHSFSSFDTATMGGLIYRQTVLAKIAKAAGLAWDTDSAHSAIYDAEQTAKLFCIMVNRWQAMLALERQSAG